MPSDAVRRRGPTRRLPWIGAVLAALLGVVASEVWLFGPVWATGMRFAIPSPVSTSPDRTEREARTDALRQGDQLFAVWAVGRNARTWIRDPMHLFDAELCHPFEKALALGEPMLTMGLLGVPGWLVTGDPVASYNVALALMTALAALAMFALVWRWTGSAAAGMVGGILYAFGDFKLRELVHPYIQDTSWIVLALLFAREWIARGHWRDALTMAGCCGLQMATSFYPLLAAVAIALPVGGSLVWLHGVSRLRPVQVASVAVLMVSFALLVYGPFLEIRASGEVAHLQATPPFYGSWSTFLPGGWNFPGWLALGLMLAGVGLGRGQPRVGLLAGALLAALFATGGNVMAQRWGDPMVALPNPYEWVGRVVPGLDQVRAPAALFVGVHLCMCVLAGLGAAGLLGRLPRRSAAAAGAALVALTWVATFRPAFLGLDPPVVPRPLRVRPPEPDLRLAERLAQTERAGAVIEVPLGARDFRARSAAILLTAYHGRPTSACHSSQRPEQSERVEQLGRRLPAPDALAELRRMGFGTVLVHHSPRRPADGAWARRFAQTGPEAPLQLLYATPRMTAYLIAER